MGNVRPAQVNLKNLKLFLNLPRVRKLFETYTKYSEINNGEQKINYSRFETLFRYFRVSNKFDQEKIFFIGIYVCFIFMSGIFRV